ncbi:hypothetical protein SAMN04324258_3490 [Krasilnikoviella flava]|uniref:Uncharacterized protein n=1 Tax=Krasilnikoviella flava TaxID=526729 RepID=A0A1T5LIJ6_9MICO|nr:hypothetical protein SAMN04324258_3490 [Krasilnikoviella flava]
MSRPAGGRRRVADAVGVRRGPAAVLLVMLLALVGALVSAYLGHRLAGWPAEPGFRLGREWGYGEVLFAVQVAWAAGLLGWVAVRLRWPVMAAWALGFVVVLVDDRLMLHERAGAWLARSPAPVAGPAIGELVWLAGLALVLGAVLLAAHLRSSPAARAASIVLLLLTVALAGFGVLVDQLHVVVEGRAPHTYLVTAVEEGGELAVLSVIVAYLFAVACDGHRPGHDMAGTRAVAPSGMRQPLPASLTRHPSGPRVR